MVITENFNDLSASVCYCSAGDAPVCDPKAFYECASVSLEDYVSNNKAATCNCPRQCRHLTYNHDISQALVSNHLINFATPLHNYNRTTDEIRYDYCSLEVSYQTLGSACAVDSK